MGFFSNSFARIDEQGRLILPPEVIHRYGLQPGAKVYLSKRENVLSLRRPVSHLAKVYVEPTNACNLNCRTCIRNSWQEPLGQMSQATFQRVLQGLPAFSPVPTVFFGGFGEPLAHPDIIEMVTQAKALGASVELVTNGTMLTRCLSRQLIEAGLDLLWVSLDGATPQSYADVRLGAEFANVLGNLREFRNAQQAAYRITPHLGIVFVAMKRNVGDLPALVTLGRQLGAKHFLVSNVLPYTEEMCQEVLYTRAVTNMIYETTQPESSLELTRLDVNEITRKPLYQILHGDQSLSFAGVSPSEGNDRCPFIESGATAISWEGYLSPCLPLLHSHVSFLLKRERLSRHFQVGNIMERTLKDLWNAPEYLALRKRVQTFDFSPCTSCGGCFLAEANEEDCFGNTFPTCGGCLWAQGVIRCP
jgi:MoaA/NifB/PqqE/SkfB family radical SAM enzyme